MHRRTLLHSVATIGLLHLNGTVAAQVRVSDDDIKKLMENLKEDSKEFSENFKDDLSKSSIRHTSDEKTAKQLAERFPKQTEGMLKQFKNKKNANAALPAVSQSLQSLDQYMGKISPGRKTTDSWSRVKEGMNLIGKALNYTPAQ